MLETLQIRTRQDPERDPSLLASLLEAFDFHVEAVERSCRALGVQVVRAEPPEGADLAVALPGVTVRAHVGETAHITQTELFTHRPRRTVQTSGQSVWLARSVLHSP